MDGFISTLAFSVVIGAQFLAVIAAVRMKQDAHHAGLTDIVKRVERGELEPDPRHITELRLN